MPLTCNIDARGKRARLIWGLLMLCFGIALAVAWAAADGGIWRWAVSAFVVASGVLAIFEARAGWCALRAMGIRTPM